MQAVEDKLRALGRVDLDGRLIEADAALLSLQQEAGGEPGGVLAIPQIAAIARTARRLGINVSRAVIAANGAQDLDLWVKAEPDDNSVRLEITGWSQRAAYQPSPYAVQRGEDFDRVAEIWSWECDAGLRIQAVSHALAEAAGAAPAELVGEDLTRLFRLIPGTEGDFALLDALAAHKPFKGQDVELRAGNPNRQILSGVPLIDGAGRFAGFRGQAVKAATGPVADAEQVEAQAQAFGARLDQALRAPLDRIITNAETIGAQGDGPIRRDYVGYASDIASAGRHLLSLVDDLVDLQAIERDDYRPDMEHLDLADIGRRAVGLLSVRAANANVRLIPPGDEESVPASGEFRRTLQIAMNLITNAIRYAPPGSTVIVAAVGGEGGPAALSVSDSGKGIEIEDQARIFEKFERVDTSEPGGTGLGLYISRRLARAMGGDLTVSSTAGEGARFTLTLAAS